MEEEEAGQREGPAAAGPGRGRRRRGRGAAVAHPAGHSLRHDRLHPCELPGRQRRAEAPHLKGVQLGIRQRAVAVGVAGGKDPSESFDAERPQRAGAPGGARVEQRRSRVHHGLERVVEHLAHEDEAAGAAFETRLDAAVGAHHGHDGGLEVLGAASEVALAPDQDHGSRDSQAGEVGHPAGADALEGVVAAWSFFFFKSFFVCCRGRDSGDEKKKPSRMPPFSLPFLSLPLSL